MQILSFERRIILADYSLSGPRAWVALMWLCAALPDAHADGPLFSWGYDGFGQVSDTPTIGTFSAIAAGGSHSVAIRTDGTLASWGGDDFGQVSDTPTVGTYSAVAAGFFHSLALRTDGTLVSWGYNGYHLVIDTPTIGAFSTIACGGFHSVAIRTDGTLFSWGDNSRLQSSSTPSGSFAAVAVGSDHCVAIRTDGTLVSWGSDDVAQITDTPTIGFFSAIVAGNYHSVALRTDGALVSWGDNSWGQLSGTPSGNFAAVSAGNDFSVAIRTDKTLVAWGRDVIGTVSGTPLGIFSAVSAGNGHLLAIVDDDCPLDPNKTDPGTCGCGVPDTDSDADGVPDCVDNCPNTPNANQSDLDGDGSADACDNCPTTPNIDQADSDIDGIGDACDAPPLCVLIPTGASWKYLEAYQGTGWSALGFDDSAWGQGPAAFGVENNPLIAPLIQTALNVSSGNTSYYFRHQFNFPGNPAGVALNFSARIDDGAVFYLNGSEIQRIRMPAGTIGFSTFASSAPPGSDAVNLELFTVTSSALVMGNNVLAVEVHQVNSGSTDVVFDLTLKGSCPPDPCLADTTAPVVPVVTLANTIAANQTAVPLSISGEVGATISYVISDGTSAVNGSGTVPVGGTFSVTVNLSSLLDGPLSASATLTDACGSTSVAGTTTASKNTVPQTPPITWPTPTGIIYGTPLGAAQLNATTTVPGTFAYSPTAGTVLAAGVGQTLMVSFTPNDLTSYNPATASVLIDVTPQALTVKAQNKNNVYGSALPTLTATYTGFVNGDSVASLDTPAVLSTTATAASGVGTYPIVVSGASDANYAITFVNGTLTVMPHPLTITAKDKNNVYGSAPPTLAATYAGFVNGDNVASLDTAAVFSTTATAASGVGNYPIVVSGASDANYTITFVNGTLTVTPKTLTVKAQNKSNVYGTGLPTLTATYQGFVNGDGVASLDTPVVLSTTATAASGVGIYPIVVSGASDANYTITFVNGTLSVAPHALTIKAQNKNNVYGTALPTLTATYQGFVNGDTVASLDTAAVLSTTATPASAVGTYPIVVSGATDANYTIAFLNGTLTVTP